MREGSQNNDNDQNAVIMIKIMLIMMMIKMMTTMMTNDDDQCLFRRVREGSRQSGLGKTSSSRRRSEQVLPSEQRDRHFCRHYHHFHHFHRHLNHHFHVYAIIVAIIVIPQLADALSRS